MVFLFAFIGVILLVIVVVVFVKSNEQFDDPQSMSNHQLVSRIAGQADWLEKMGAAPIDSQNDPSIIVIAEKRKAYIARLCMEALSRDPEDQMKYPGATSAVNVFSVAGGYAKELEALGISRDIAAVRAVKEKLFIANGINYPASWET